MSFSTRNTASSLIVLLGIMGQGCEPYNSDQSGSRDANLSLKRDNRGNEAEESTSIGTEHDTAKEPEALTEIAVSPPAPTVEEPERLYERVLSPKSFHYANVFRWEVRIYVPAGLSSEALEAQLELAARNVFDERRADAVSVLAYQKGDATDGVATVAQATLAPNGKWINADLDPKLHPLQFATDWIAEGYLSPIPSDSHPQPGDGVVLKPSFGETVAISKSRDDWGDEFIIARVPAETQAVVVSREFIPLYAGERLVRYQVRLAVNGQTITGWVGRYNVEDRE